MNAPKIPPSVAPTMTLTRTTKGDSPKVLRMTIGTTMFDSASWITM